MKYYNIGGSPFITATTATSTLKSCDCIITTIHFIYAFNM